METTNATSVGNVMSAMTTDTNEEKGTSGKMNAMKNVMSAMMSGTSARVSVMNAGNGTKKRVSAASIGSDPMIGHNE
jgi:hypothetical protein